VKNLKARLRQTQINIERLQAFGMIFKNTLYQFLKTDIYQETKETDILIKEMFKT